MKNWTKEEINFLIKNYNNISNEELSSILGKTKKSIDSKSIRLNLKKDKLYINKINKSRVIDSRWKEKSWTKDEIDYLNININKFSNNELSLKLKKTTNSIVSACNRLGIKRQEKYNYNYIKSQSRKYITKSELRMLNPNLYQWLYNNDKLKEFTSHMFTISYSTPQLILGYILKKNFNKEFSYNNRSIIKPYEIDIFFNDYNLGFEYDGKYYHPEPNKNKILLCKNKGIKLIIINEYNLLKRNFDEYLKNIKFQIIENLPTINKCFSSKIEANEIQNTFIDKEMIFKNLFNLNGIKKICEKYIDYSKFIKEQRNIYNKLYYLGLLKEYTKHMKIEPIKERTNLEYLIERSNFYKIGDIILIEYWYNGMICPVKIIDQIGKSYKITHNIPQSKIFNAPDEKIKSTDIIDIYKN